MNRVRSAFPGSVLIALLGGCASHPCATPATSAGSAPGVPTAARADAAGAWTRLRCSEMDVVVDFSVTPVRLVVDDEAFALRPVPAASGAKYEAIGDPATTLWNKGASTTLTLRGVTLPECRDNAANASRPPASVPNALP
jgi:membrane-bound inhibitor of C-type lysozyme